MKTKTSSKTSSSPSDKELKLLRKEVEALKKQLARVQKFVEATKKPDKVRAKRAVVDSLEVLNPEGKVVASIDKNGNLFCATVWASTDKNKRGVFIDGVTYRKVQAATVELVPPSGNTPGVEATCSASGGKLTLRSLEKGSKQLLLLQGTGEPLIANDDKSGAAAVMIRSNSPAGGSIDLLGTEAGSKAEAKLSVSHLTSAGAVYLTDKAGTPVGRLP